MNKFWIILSHTYMSRFKTKTFMVTNLILLLLIVGAVNIQNIMDVFSDKDKDEIAVIDKSGEYLIPLKKGIENANDDIKIVAFEESEKKAKEAVQNEKYNALVIVSLNEKKLPKATYYASNITSSGLQQTIQEQLQKLKVSAAVELAGIDQGKIAAIYAPISFNTVALDESAKTGEELNQARGIVYAMVMLMYFVVILYGQMIATDVATEKSSKVMELLISSASPVTHMFAKIFGIALLGLTQIVVFIGVAYGLIISKKEELVGGMLDKLGFLDIPVSLIIYGIVFFLLGYVLYATLAAMLGSLVSRSEDAQQMIMPMMFLLIIALFIAMYGLTSPEASLVTISSYIPFFAPMLMLLRIGMLDIGLLEVALSLGILVGTIILLAIIGARVYKGGVLMYGKSSSLKDIKKAIALSKKE